VTNRQKRSAEVWRRSLAAAFSQSSPPAVCPRSLAAAQQGEQKAAGSRLPVSQPPAVCPRSLPAAQQGEPRPIAAVRRPIAAVQQGKRGTMHPYPFLPAILQRVGTTPIHAAVR